jgi:hypothetical protein
MGEACTWLDPVTRAVLSCSLFIFQCRLAKGSPTILEVYKQYQTSSSPKKKVQVQGHVAAQKSESSDSSSGMLCIVTRVDAFSRAVESESDSEGIVSGSEVSKNVPTLTPTSI